MKKSIELSTIHCLTNALTVAGCGLQSDTEAERIARNVSQNMPRRFMGYDNEPRDNGSRNLTDNDIINQIECYRTKIPKQLTGKMLGAHGLIMEIRAIVEKHDTEDLSIDDVIDNSRVYFRALSEILGASDWDVMKKTEAAFYAELQSKAEHEFNIIAQYMLESFAFGHAIEITHC